MSAVVGWLVFGLYCAAVMGTWCAGAFGIGTSINDRREAAMRHGRRAWHTQEYQDRSALWHLTTRVLLASAVTFASGLIWPVAVPLYLAFRKGLAIDDALTKRNALLKKQAAS